MLTKFTIPGGSNTKYPLNEIDNTVIRTNSWFDFTGNETMCDVTSSNETVMRAEQVIIKPTSVQLKLLTEWLELYRYTYNQTIHHSRFNKIESFFTMRKIIKGRFPPEITKRIATCRIPIHSVDNAVKDAILAYKTSFALHKGKKRFRIRYKKSNANQTIVIESSSFSKKVNSFSSKIGIIKSDLPIMGITHDCKLSKRGNSWILFVPEDKPKKVCEREIRCCSLDPGIRTFQTVYCDNGDTYTLGNNVSSNITPLINKVNASANKKHQRRLRYKIKHKIDDLHWKSANILCKMSDKILIGNMSTIGILRGNLTSGTKRLIQSVSHYTFRMRLKSKCEEYGVEFVVADESYTSKTCGTCGQINSKLGSSKTFKCSCGFNVDRDINGARNIMIKTLR